MAIGELGGVLFLFALGIGACVLILDWLNDSR